MRDIVEAFAAAGLGLLAALVVQYVMWVGGTSALDSSPAATVTFFVVGLGFINRKQIFKGR